MERNSRSKQKIRQADQFPSGLIYTRDASCLVGQRYVAVSYGTTQQSYVTRLSTEEDKVTSGLIEHSVGCEKVLTTQEAVRVDNRSVRMAVGAVYEEDQTSSDTAIQTARYPNYYCCVTVGMNSSLQSRNPCGPYPRTIAAGITKVSQPLMSRPLGYGNDHIVRQTWELVARSN